MALSFDKKKNILYAYKNECAVPDVRKAYQLNASVYENAQKYYNNPNYLRHEMVDKWFPAFQKMLGVTDDQLALEDIIIRQQDPQEPIKDRMQFNYDLDIIDYSTEAHKKGSKVDHYTKYEVLMKFKVKGFTKTSYIPVMCIPWVRKDGIIEYNGAEYAFIHMLEQTDGISYNPNNTNSNPPKISLRTNRNNIMLSNNEKDGIIVELGKSQKLDMISLVSAMLRKEMVSGIMTDKLMEVWNQFADSDIVNLRNEKELFKFNAKWFYSGGSTRRRGVSDVINTIAPQICGLPIDGVNHAYDKYDTTNLREELNNILSLRQALNKELAKPVLNPDGTVMYHAGKIVTEFMVDQFNRNGVYIVYVKDDVDIEGAVLDEDIITSYIPRGTIVTDEIEEAFPDEDGMYTVRDHKYTDYIGKGIDHVFMIEKGTILSSSDVSRIRDSGRDGVLIKNGNKQRRVNFYTEIISNKQFKGEWIGKERGEWYYLDMDGQYIKPLGVGYTAYDMIALWSYAVKALRGKPTIKLPNIDEDFRKQLIPINEQFSRAMNYAIQNGMKQMKQTFAAWWKSDKIVEFTQHDSELVYKFYAFERLFWKYLYKESKCVRMIPATALNNPVAYISEVTKANVYTASKNSVSDSQRTISIGSYGKIDPYEIPQSGKIGVVNNLCSYVNIDEEGHISTPYYRVSHLGGKAKVDFDSGYQFLTVEQEEKHVIADICSMTISNDGSIKESDDTLVLCMVPGNNKNRRIFDKLPISRVEYVNVNAMQPLSWASSTIPFLCNNDAARAVFAVAQMKQAKGLEYPEEPLVMTSAYEMIPKLNRKFGYVCTKNEHLHMSERDRRSDEWNIITADHDASVTNQPINEDVSYPEFRQGDNSVMTIKPLKLLDESQFMDSPKLNEGDVVVSSNFVSDRGLMQFGVNAFALFIPDGYNYEDSAHISETFSRKMTSFRVNEEILPVKPTTRMPRIRNTAEHPIQTSLPFIPGTDNDTFDCTYNDHSKGTVKFSRKIKHAYGTYIGQYGHQDNNGRYDGVVVQLLSRDPAKTGDKLSNRHGNKCTVCKVSNEDMPYINNGRQADICLNPLGVGSRMNIGQIKELTLGLVMHVLGISICTDAYNCISDTEIKTLLKFTWSVANESTHYSELPANVPYPGDLDTIMARSEFSSIPDSIKAHCRENFDKIQVWRNTFDQDGTFEYHYLEDVHEVDEDGNDIIVKRESKGRAVGGFIYIFKLTQESYKKIHARANDMSDEEYSKLTDAPTQGAARGGGQRMGTMEIDALCAYDVPDYISELFNVRADNAIARENFNLDTYFDPRIVKEYKSNGTGQRRAVTELMYTLLSLGIMTTTDGDEIIPLSKNNGEDLKHVKGQFIQRELGKHGYGTKNTEEDEPTEVTPENAVSEEVANSVMSKISFTED